MIVKLAYGKTGLSINVPDNTTVIQPEYIPGLPDAAGAILTAIRNPIFATPLRMSVMPGQKVGISVCDITRPMPSKVLLPILLRELSHIPSEDITIFIATGTHRPNSYQEIKEMLGREVLEHGCQIVNHNSFDKNTLTNIGTTSEGIPIYLNSAWLLTDFKITMGFVEPHFFAGFSGGPKMIAPGLAGFETIMNLHNSRMISNPKSIWGVTVGNPIHDAIREIASISPADFSIEITINRDHEITSVFAGNQSESHRAASRFTRKTAMQKVEEPFDVVVTTNSGYPLDINLYQAVKGMSAASQIVREGGSIICAAECSDGMPEHGSYKEILLSENSPQALLDLIEGPDYNRHDQWQVQIQAKILMKSNVYLKTDYLSDREVRQAHLAPIKSIESTLQGLLTQREKKTVCILPEGPQTIPYIS